MLSLPLVFGEVYRRGSGIGLVLVKRSTMIGNSSA